MNASRNDRRPQPQMFPKHHKQICYMHLEFYKTIQYDTFLQQEPLRCWNVHLSTRFLLAIDLLVHFSHLQHGINIKEFIWYRVGHIWIVICPIKAQSRWLPRWPRQTSLLLKKESEKEKEGNSRSRRKAEEKQESYTCRPSLRHEERQEHWNPTC